MNAPSPTPSNMPPPVKRPRTSNFSGAAGGAPGPSRTKRRKAEESDADDRRGGPVNFGVGMVKGREDEWGEPADVATKIDFNDLPVETLYRYLEVHDLLPRWDPSPWSEEPCTPPNALFAPAPPAQPVAIVPEPTAERTSPVPPSREPETAAPAPPNATPIDLIFHANGTDLPPPADGEGSAPADGAKDTEGDDAMAEGHGPAAPTTRSKTAPTRKAATPTPSPPPEIKRGVITLSDVMAARGVLAEKANAHWVKGLGGGQNRESETIVQLLYKLKAGPHRLLRIYNPWPSPHPYQ